MKILQLCHKVPYPPIDGGCIAMNNLTQGLISLGYQIKILAINTPKHFTDVTKLPNEYVAKTAIETVFVDTNVKVIPALKNLFTNTSYNIERFYATAFEKKLIELLKSTTFDVIQLESLYMSRYVDAIRKHSNAKIILRAHNIEHQIWERNAETTNNPIKKAYLNLLAKRLKNYELNSITTFDAIACITKADELFFKNHHPHIPIQTFPFGIDFSNNTTPTSTVTEPFSVFHIGAMDWLPNIEGVKWFLNTIWPLVITQHPNAKLYLAGKNMPAWLSQLKTKNVIVKGEVENAADFMNSKSIMIVPLLSGGGMRVKIIEGMMLGKTIVSTAIGAEGINYTNQKDIVIANTPKAFAEAIINCIINTKFCNDIGSNAKKLILSEYNNIDICKKLENFYLQLLNKK
jgi:glycosyltransferase involved in cell wall biosynthesis